MANFRAGPGKYKMRLENLVPVNKEVLKNNGGMSERHRSQFE